MLKTLSLVVAGIGVVCFVGCFVVCFVGCEGPEAYRERPGAGVGAAGSGAPGGGAGAGVLPIMTTGAAGSSTGVAGMQPDPLAGAAGSTGAAGSSTGAAGDMTGGAGSTGAAGATGAAGSTAAAGSNGGAGSTGAAGATGAAGSNGGGGSTGAAGQQGGAGASGAAGAPVQSMAYASTGWKATASITAAGTADVATNAFDGKITTRWSTGRNQLGDETFTIDLGAVESVSRVLIDDSTHPTDFPVAYTLEVSTNGTTFTAVKMGKGAAMTDIQFTRTNARYIRIRQTGTTPAGGSWWSIDELKIYS